MKKILVLIACALLLSSGCASEPETTTGTDERPSPSVSPTAAPDPATAALEEALTTAYNGAAGYARSNGNFFARNTKEKGELAAAVSTKLSTLSSGVGSSFSTDGESLTLCSPYDDAPMVRVFTPGKGDELVLAASDQAFVLTLTYVPGGEPEISEPSQCKK